MKPFATLAVLISSITGLLAGGTGLQVHAKESSERTAEAEAAFRRGVVHLKNEEHESAVQAFTTAIELCPEYVEAYRQRAAAYEALDDISKYYDDRERAAEIELAREFSEEFPRHIARYTVPFVACAALAAYLLAAKGRQPALGLLLGMFLGPIGVFIAFVMPEKDKQRFTIEPWQTADDPTEDPAAEATCPMCGRVNSVRTRVCPRCETHL